jgi:hypothetical protein
VNAKRQAEYYLDAVGRRRKLSAGAMLAIQREYRAGARSADLAATYGVSTSTIRAVCYMTARDADKDRIEEGVHHTKPHNDDKLTS